MFNLPPFNMELSITGHGITADFVVFTVGWTLLQVLLFQWPDLSSYKMDRKTHYDFRNRLVSFIHGVVALVVSAY
jgi:hypothetical protein